MLNFLQDNSMWLLLLFMLVMSSISLALMCVDKFRAVKKEGRRIPERTLLLLSLLFGGVGTLLGMVALRHKVNAKRHPAFAFGVPLMALVQCGILVAMLLHSVQ